MKKAGFKKKFLKQKETALEIYAFLIRNIDPQSETGISNNAFANILIRKQTNLNISNREARNSSFNTRLRERDNSNSRD